MAKQKPLLRTHSHSLTAAAQTSEAVAASVSKGAVAGWLVLSAPAVGGGRRAAAHLPRSPAVMVLSLLRVSPSFFSVVISEFLSDRVWHSTWL